jgi:uncharacterized protein (DUF362 family)/NAD-dependent dihydropyrimidine dehydrogenase PreA subunit
MERSRVALVRCDGYDPAAVSRAVADGIHLLGGVERFAAPEEQILLKPNVLAGDDPQRLVSPHPSVVSAVAGLLRGRTSRLIYGDSPGFGRPETALRKAGLDAAAEEWGARPADFTNGREVSFPESPFTRRFLLAEGVLSSDGIVSISKLKSHAFMRMTGAVKNQFGCIPGASKAAFHLKLQEPADFGRMLAALTLCLRPRLYVMDGITAMQGNGPRSGDPCRMNVLLFSTDPVALDAVMCRLVEMDPAVLATCTAGLEYGLGTWRAEEIEVVGDPVQPLVNGDFAVRRSVESRSQIPRAVGFLVKKLVAARPLIDPRRCTRCGTCITVCPVAPPAVRWREPSHARPPAYDHERCIRCYCCQEACPEKAIRVKAGLFGR